MSGERPRPSHDRGAVLVETALVVTLLAVVAGGIAEVSHAWQARSGVERASHTMVRALGAFTPAASTDASALAIAAAFGNADGIEVRRVVVFRSQGASGVVPAMCRRLWPTTVSPSGVDGVCNVYGPAHLARVARGTVWTGCGSSSPQQFWCPSSRSRTRPGPDRLGIHLDLWVEAPRLSWRVGQRRGVATTAVVELDPEVS